MALLCLSLTVPSSGRVSATSAKSAHPLILGVFTPNAPDPTEITQYAHLVHAKPAIVMWYSDFSTPLVTARQTREVDALHTTPLISWRPTLGWSHPIPFWAIAHGKYDDYLRAQAVAARDTHRLIMVRFAYEMNLAGGVYGSHVQGETPQSFIAAWRHVVILFRDAGATNVRWVWSPNTDCAGRCPFSQYFPGNVYVDWLGLDGYNFAAAHHTPWVSLHWVFATSYNTITSLSSKPIIFAEVASATAPGDKARWIRSGFLHAIPHQFPQVRAAVWFDSDKEADWRVNSSRASLKAWRAVTTSPRYSGTLPLAARR